MSAWTHSICDDCWKEKEPDKIPSRIAEPETEICCYCGQETKSGIFVRDNPNALRCKGRHAE